MVVSTQFFPKFPQNLLISCGYQKVGNNIFHKKAVESIALKLQVIYSMAKCSYYAVNYGATALKICYDTDHQKVGEQHISQKLL